MIIWPSDSNIIAMALGIILTGLILAYAENNTRNNNRLKIGLLCYALPGLPLMALGIAAAAARYPMHAARAMHCPDAMCRMAVFRDANLAQTIDLGIAEAVCMGLMAIIFGARSFRVWSRLRSTLPVIPGFGDGEDDIVFKKEKWYRDPESGEAYRIIFEHNGRIMFDTTPYRERHRLHTLAYREFHESKKGFYWSAILAPISLIPLSYISNVYGEIAIYLFLIIPLTGSAISCATKIVFGAAFKVPITKARVGPPPLPDYYGQQQVEDRNVYGKFEFLTGDELRRASGAAGVGNLPTPDGGEKEFDG